MKWAAIALGVGALLLSGVAVGLALDARSRIDDFEKAQAEQAAAVGKRVSKIQETLTLLDECLPELRSYVDAVEIDEAYDNTLYVTKPGAISRHCARILGYSTVP